MGMQHAPVWKQGLGEQDAPEYHALPVGHWDWGTFTAHPPVAALQQAPVAVEEGQGLGWQAVEPPPKKEPPEEGVHPDGVVIEHTPDRQQAPD